MGKIVQKVKADPNCRVPQGMSLSHTKISPSLNLTLVDVRTFILSSTDKGHALGI